MLSFSVFYPLIVNVVSLPLPGREKILLASDLTHSDTAYNLRINSFDIPSTVHKKSIQISAPPLVN